MLAPLSDPSLVLLYEKSSVTPAKPESPSIFWHRSKSNKANSDKLQPGKNPPPAPTPLRAAKEPYDGLTAREREVAALISQGKSNAAIAFTSYMGVRTVEAHITRILMKLGYTSHTQTAAWTVQRRLGQPENETPPIPTR